MTTFDPMRNLFTLMLTFAIVTVASIAPAPASAETMGANIDIGMVYDANDAVSVKAGGFEVSYEYRCNFNESATVSVLIAHVAKATHEVGVDVSSFGYVSGQSGLTRFKLETDDYRYKAICHEDLPDSTDTFISRRARDGLTC